MTIKSGQTFKYLENEKRFYGEIKSIFYHFKGVSLVKHYLTPESAPLIFQEKIFISSERLEEFQ